VRASYYFNFERLHPELHFEDAGWIALMRCGSVILARVERSTTYKVSMAAPACRVDARERTKRFSPSRQVRKS